jgi:hypothetical protein
VRTATAAEAWEAMAELQLTKELRGLKVDRAYFDEAFAYELKTVPWIEPKTVPQLPIQYAKSKTNQTAATLDAWKMFYRPQTLVVPFGPEPKLLPAMPPVVTEEK